jgi:hypothetical protein
MVQLLPEPPVRIELTTARLQGECSTTELRRQSSVAHHIAHCLERAHPPVFVTVVLMRSTPAATVPVGGAR